MEIMNLVQGDPAWHKHRSLHFNASDAPAMLGISPYMSRGQLLHQMATGITPEVSEYTQRMFDKGHRFEALARPLAEDLIGEELYPAILREGKLSASYDGLTMDNSVQWEHKMLGDTIRDSIIGGDDLPEHYRAQMDQQMMISGAGACLFMGSLWDDDNNLIEELHCWYLPDQVMRDRILRGWVQFAVDLQNYQYVEPVAEVVGRAPETLPALRIQVTGMVTASNLAEFREHALAVIGSINRDLQTDADFANAEKAVKWCAEVEDRLEAEKQRALSQTASIDELFRTMDSIKEEARTTRLELNRLVDARKKSIRVEIQMDAAREFAGHMAMLNARLPTPCMPVINADFGGAMKGKSKITNLREAVANELVRVKLEANAIADKIEINLNTLNKMAENHKFLFADTARIALKEHDDFIALVKARIADHSASEEKRIANERERIRREEEARANKKIEDEVQLRLKEAKQMEEESKDNIKEDLPDSAKKVKTHPAFVNAPYNHYEDLPVPDIVDRLRGKTCGEISCAQCNDEREAAADEIERLRKEIENLVADRKPPNSDAKWVMI